MDNSDPFLTKMLEMIFNGGGHYFTDRPMRPLHEESTVEPFQQKPSRKNRIFTLFYNRPTYSFDDRTTSIRPFHKETTVTPVFERTTATPIYKRPLPVRPHHDTALQNRPTIGTATTIQVVHSSGLEKCLWVALGGIGVLILMAFFMKLGKPIRRVRRHLSNARTSPVSPDNNLDMGSNARLVDTNEPGYNDPPPPYIECISINQCDSEEPPPRYSASFVDYNNAEPQVHIRQQKHNTHNALSENGVTVEFIANTLTCNDSDDIVTGKKTELVFDNGRIVERLSLYRNASNNKTGVASNDNVEEQSNLLFKSRV